MITDLSLRDIPRKKKPQERQLNVKCYYITLAYILNLYLATEIIIIKRFKNNYLFPILVQYK